MVGPVRNIQIDDDVPSLVKEMTQDAINLFEGSAGQEGPSQFTDEDAARETLGTSGTVASGRMSLTFAIEMLRRYFGSDVFNHSGVVDLRFLRPVRPGDTITFEGKTFQFPPMGPVPQEVIAAGGAEDVDADIRRLLGFVSRQSLLAVAVQQRLTDASQAAVEDAE